MRYINVRVLDRSGKPVSQARISIGKFGIDQGVFGDQKYTDSDGLAQFALDLGDYDDICVYVNGEDRTGRTRPKAEFFITT
jgi:hypothetical protein